jgi:hypothetical protein
VSCSSDHQAATFSIDHQAPSLADMRANSNAVSQASQIVDSIDAGPSGNSINSIKTLRQGWSRQGGDFAPRVVIP